jgi:PAS domain S-box-containing protein
MSATSPMLGPEMRRPPGHSPARVLAVDDREENLEALEALLRRDGLAVDVARSGSDALELLLRNEYAVALVDVQMPEMSGFELAKLMRGSERTKHVPIIFVTAGAVDAGAVAEGYESGAVDVLFKPVEPFVLRSKVRVFVELHRQKRALAEAARARAALNEELREAMDEAARSSALLDGMLGAAPIGIAFLDHELRYRRVNEALSAINGLPAAAHLGKRVVELLPGLPSEALEGAWRRVMETGEPLFDFEVTGTTPATGSDRRTWRETFYPVRVHGKIIGVGTIVRDVTPEKRADELQRFLVGIVGHDLRNPLSALTTTVELLGRGEALSERQRALTLRMRSSTERMKRLIDDLLDYTRVRGGGGIPVEPRPMNVAEVLAAVVQESRTVRPDCVIDVRGTGDGRGEWDPDRLRQVLANLVDNATKHGDPALPVQVSWQASGAELVVEVSNAGPPIPRDVLPTLFEPLAQREGAPRRSGIGLGLFIARQLVEAHGGTIAARSDGGGTVFTVRLPRDAARAEATAPPV